MKFTLEIELGNDAMQTYVNIRTALREVAVMLGASTSAHRKITKVDGGRIMDVNGNTVGAWEVK